LFFQLLARQFRIRQPLADDLGNELAESCRIIRIDAVVVTEYLLIHISVQMERLDGHIGSAQAPLKQRPEILNSVCVDSSIHVGEFGKAALAKNLRALLEKYNERVFAVEIDRSLLIEIPENL
jgi:hypothetical protein